MSRYSTEDDYGGAGPQGLHVHSHLVGVIMSSTVSGTETHSPADLTLPFVGRVLPLSTLL